MSGSRTYSALAVERIVRVTDKAVLVRVDGDDYWFPRSTIEDGEDIEAGHEELDLHVQEWVLEERGLL